MTEQFATPGDIVDLHVLRSSARANQPTLLVDTRSVEISQLLIPAGAMLPTYEAEGEIILHCLEGQVCVKALGAAQHLTAGQLIYLTLNEPFSIEGIESAALLITIIAPKLGRNVQLIGARKAR